MNEDGDRFIGYDVEVVEQDLGVPVVQPTAARIWEIQRRLHVRQPIKGYGTLLETLPA